MEKSITDKATKEKIKNYFFMKKHEVDPNDMLRIVQVRNQKMNKVKEGKSPFAG